MKTITRYLVVDSTGENVRVLKARPHSLPYNEIAFPLTIQIPDLWGRVLAEAPIRLALPNPERPYIVVGSDDGK